MDGRKEQTQRADSFCGRQAVKPVWLQSAYCANWSMEKSRLLSGVFFLLYIFICAVWILDFEETAIHTNDLTRDISGTRRSQETNKRSRIFAIPKTDNETLIDASIHQIEDKEFAEHSIDMLVEAMGDSGDYAILTGSLSAPNQNLWIDYAKTYAAEKYPNLNLVTDPIPTEEKQQEAYSKTLDLVKAYPDLKGIVGYATVCPLGAAQAIREKGLQDQIAVVGTAVKEDAQEFIEDGSLDIAFLWNTQDLGALTVKVAKYLLDGNELSSDMTIDGFPDISVDGNVVYLGPPEDYTKDTYK